MAEVPRTVWVLASSALLVAIASGGVFLARQLPYAIRLERIEEPKTMDRVVKTEPIGPAQPLVPPITTTQETVAMPKKEVVPKQVPIKPKPKMSKTRELLQKKWGR